MGDKWSLEVGVVQLPLAERFTIARESWDMAESVIVRLAYGGDFGVGEAQPAGRWGETLEGTVRELEELDLSPLGVPEGLEALDELMPAGAAKSALDIALHDLAAKRRGQTVREYLGVSGVAPATSITVAIADVSTTLERVRRLQDAPIIKTKVGFDGDVDMIERIREVYGGVLRIDANEGWEPDEAIEKLNALERSDIELCEQPIPGGRRDELARVTAASPILVFADEDVLTAEDVRELLGKVDGVNLKLKKTGGISEALRAVDVAEGLGMRSMLGCNLESGIGLSAGAQIAAAFDHIDLDSITFLESDPFPSVAYDRGHLVLPDAPGLGVTTDPRDVWNDR
jgi:L-alanine-DL-glutamate epimerase-like enolase superfamily enzyme